MRLPVPVVESLRRLARREALARESDVSWVRLLIEVLTSHIEQSAIDESTLDIVANSSDIEVNQEHT
jgi:hypothetical protein